MSAARNELSKLLNLSIPMVLSQLSTMLLGTVDIFMLGRLGKEALASGALGNVWIHGTMISAMGLIMGVDPILTQAFGRGDRGALSLCLQRSIFFALFISIPLSLMWWFTEESLIAFGQDPYFSNLAQYYVSSQIFSLPAFLLYVALRQYLISKGIVYSVMAITMFANLVNVLLNWLLIFGHWGFPELGLIGAGIATGLTRVFMLVAVIAMMLRFRMYERDETRIRGEALSWEGFRGILKFGVPVAVQYGLEVWAFQISTLLAGRLGSIQLAAHTIVLNLASLSFMMPLGISMGAVIRIGHLIGERRYQRAQMASWVAFGLGGGVMSISAILFVCFRSQLAAAYTPDVDVIVAAAAVLPVAAAFQLFDGLQVVGGGILRAMGRTVPAAVFNFVGYYILALPIASWITFPEGLNLGLAGIWWGCAIGLATVAILLLLWVARRGPAHLGSLGSRD